MGFVTAVGEARMTTSQWSSTTRGTVIADRNAGSYGYHMPWMPWVTGDGEI